MQNNFFEIALSKALGVIFYTILIVHNIGTGKTRTIVATIVEMIRSTRNNILVCAPSNAACDEIAIRLLGYLHEVEIFRMYAKSFNVTKVSTKLKPICNLKNGKFEFPCLKYIYRFRVVITTVLTAGCFTRAREMDPEYNSSHFSHIFVDEAAFMHETMSLIPIAGKLIPVFYLTFLINLCILLNLNFNFSS